ncbi:hypothetical protein GLYMA_19G234751v4 [Glycine max]|nr:hypothetical protein GLYMA_19G234751v4 [Glycine max]
MAPTKKPRTTTNKRFSSLSEVSPKKDEVGSSKNKQRVAENVSSRSVEMVKALHSISQAYLSMPKESASAVGLIAMMTDYYNMVVWSKIKICCFVMIVVV